MLGLTLGVGGSEQFNAELWQTVTTGPVSVLACAQIVFSHPTDDTYCGNGDRHSADVV